MSESIPKQWAEQARYDLETARAMLESGRYIYVLFCCQQAVEKALKGVIAQNTGEMPPRIHNLLSLSKRAELTLNADQLDLFGELSAYYVQSRYPEEMGQFIPNTTHDSASEVLVKTEESVRWLISLIAL